MPDYRILPGTPQEAFGKLRTFVQIFGGGYGNGKTAAEVVQRILTVARDYPGANILVARATYPKLNDTIRKEFLKWCPKSWIKSFPLSKNSDNTCTLTNGTSINFRYIAQQGKSVGEGEQTTSNLLSATYDLIVIDQLEDPEITEKDFNDLVGRLRGGARYVGSDPTMPSVGPNWLVASLNPTRNWCYRRLVAPLKQYQLTGFISPLLLCKRYPRDHEHAGEPVLDEAGKPKILIGLVEGSTYTNSHNLPEGFIEGLESVYTGQSRDRFLYGEWAAYEGLVYPEFNEQTHCIPRTEMYDYLADLFAAGIEPNFIEAYDYGIAEPCCYLIGFTDRQSNVLIIDGYYKPEQEMTIDAQQKQITTLRKEYGADDSNIIRADPQLFRRTASSRVSGSRTVASLFGEGDYGVVMRQADNDIIAGVTKVSTYLNIRDHHRHPTTKVLGAPHLFIATELQFVIDEFTSYYWKQDPTGTRIDEPIGRKDHSMDTIKYMLSKEPDLAQRTPKLRSTKYLTQWSEGKDVSSMGRSIRHG